MVGVVIGHDQIVEGQRVAAAFGALAGFLIPVRLQASIGFGEACGQGRIENDRELGPVCFEAIFGAVVIAPQPSPLPGGERGLAVRGAPVIYKLAATLVEGWLIYMGLQFAVNDLFQLVEQLLSAANAEGWNQHGALILKGMLNDCFETLTAAGTVFMQAVAVRAFKDEDIGSLG